MTSDDELPGGPRPAADARQALAGDRGISPVAGRFGLSRKGQVLAVTALSVGCGLFLAATARHPAARAAAPPAAVAQVVPYEPAPAPPAAPTLAHPGPDAPVLPPSADLHVAAPRTPGDAALRPPTAAPPSPATPAPASPPLLVFSAASGDHAAAELSRTVDPAAALRTAGPVATARATRLGNRDFLILAGSTLPCILQTALATDTPGYASCLITGDVYGESGAVVLLEKGTKLLGSYRGGLAQRQSRLFVVWTRAVTPAGVSIALASPAADPLGRAGLDGTVDRRFWDRFGGALLLSVIDGGFAAAGRGEGAINLQAPSTAATAALQGAAAIPPVLRKPAGAEVAIFVAQDLDFSGVYAVQAR